jgi:hypothetical protein
VASSIESVEKRRIREILAIASDKEFCKYVSAEDAQRAIADHISADAFKDTVIHKLIEVSDTSNVGTFGDDTFTNAPQLEQVNNMELYSKRMKAAENPLTAYRYDLPVEFRNQVRHIWQDAIGFVQHTPNTMGFGGEDLYQICAHYEKINKVLCDEYGKIGLSGNSPCDALYRFFMASDTDLALDVIEVSFSEIFAVQNNRKFMNLVNPVLSAADAVTKLNKRFQERAIGYRLEHGRILRINSEFIHAEAVEPALQLMYTQGYEGAFQEFILAQTHYRQGPEHYDDCLTNCGKSLESVLKTICVKRNWAFNPNDTASKLLGIIFNNKLIPEYLQSHFGGLRATLDGGVPTIRNREGGHGSGEKPNDVPEYLAAYQLHLTASTIVFLIRANEDFDKRKP